MIIKFIIDKVMLFSAPHFNFITVFFALLVNLTIALNPFSLLSMVYLGVSDII